MNDTLDRGWRTLFEDVLDEMPVRRLAPAGARVRSDPLSHRDPRWRRTSREIRIVLLLRQLRPTYQGSNGTGRAHTSPFRVPVMVFSRCSSDAP